MAMKAAEMIFNCRIAAADLLGVDEAENIVFTSNASHSLNIAVNSLVKPGQKVLMSGFEHNSVSRPLHAKKADIKVFGRKLFDKEYVLNDFDDKIKHANLVVCTHVSNVFGFVLPIYEIAEICREKSVPLIIDASQSAGVLDVDMKRLGAAFIALPGHKGLFGPQGTGILVCNSETKPIIHGGSGSDSKAQQMPEYLPDRLEAGTHNVTGIAGLLAGIEFVKQKGVESIFSHEINLVNTMKKELAGSDYEMFYGNNQTGVLSLRHKSIDCEQLADKLSEDGICVRAGMHCAPTAHESAGTLESGTVRFSFSPFNTEEQIVMASNKLKAYSTQII